MKPLASDQLGLRQHPGKTLLKEIIARNIKQKDLACDIGIPTSQLNEILHGKRRINAEISIFLGKALDIESGFWYRLQTDYDLSHAEINNSVTKRVSEIEDWLHAKEVVPISYFKKQLNLPSDRDKILRGLFQLYEVGSINELKSKVEEDKKQLELLLRSSSKLKMDPINLIGMKYLARFKANQPLAAVFRKDRLTEVVNSLNEIFWTHYRDSNTNIIKETKVELEKHGIRFNVVKNPKSVPVDGMVFKYDEVPVITVSLRYKRLDNFAFTVMHELGHLHHDHLSTRALFYDDMSNIGSGKEEDEANQFAQENLIPETVWSEFKYYEKSDDAIIHFAEKHRIHPGILHGRLSFEHNQFYRQNPEIQKLKKLEVLNIE